MSLEKELTLSDALITSWTKSDRPQLREMACQWQWQKQLPSNQTQGDMNKDETLITFWRSSDTTDFTAFGRNSCACDGCQDGDTPCHGGSHSGPGHNSCDCNGCSHHPPTHQHNHENENVLKMNDNYPHPSSVPILNIPSSQTFPQVIDINATQRPRQGQGQSMGQSHQSHQPHVNMYNHNIQNKPKGYLVYEQSLQVGIVVRANASIGLREDLWCVLYPSELHSTLSSESFGTLLSRLFPQLEALYRRNDNIHPNANNSVNSLFYQGTTAVKYYPHQKGHSFNHPPMPPDNTQSYRTVGTASLSASVILARIAEGPTFHDFILSPI
mmetsp:Transcript_28268/g.27102  ORF Transcript_28268/g.27102 Transcript_28268/m.27102 type:complete len:327 (-) Transcript_28268:759-1739(-)